MTDSDHNPCTALGGIAAGLYQRITALAVEQERLRISYYNLGPDPRRLLGGLSIIEQGLHKRIVACGVEQERLKIQYTNCIRGIDALTYPSPDSSA